MNTHTHQLFVADTYNLRIVVFNLDSNNALTSTAASNVLGWSDLNTQANVPGATAANNFDSPDITGFDLECDSTNDRLFVTDSGNNRVMVFDVTSVTDNENALYFIGQADSTANSSAVTQSGLNKPSGLAYDAVNDRLFVSDNGNNRVLVFDVPTATNLTAIISTHSLLKYTLTFCICTM